MSILMAIKEFIDGIEITVSGGAAIFTIACYFTGFLLMVENIYNFFAKQVVIGFKV